MYRTFARYGKKTAEQYCHVGLKQLAGKLKLCWIVDVSQVCHAQGAAYVLQHLPGTSDNLMRSKTVLVRQKDCCTLLPSRAKTIVGKIQIGLDCGCLASLPCMMVTLVSFEITNTGHDKKIHKREPAGGCSVLNFAC
jgi:hypothetical protein